MTPKEALAEGAPQLHKLSPNLIMNPTLIKGDAQKAFGEAATVVDGEFSTQMNHQAPLEPEVSLAYVNKEAELVIIGRSIKIHGHVKDALGYDKVRYQEPFVGGQFGIKATITSEGIAGAAALFFKRPVRYVPSIDESMWLSSKRHPFEMKVKLGADAKGHITAYQNDMTLTRAPTCCWGRSPFPGPCRCSPGHTIFRISRVRTSSCTPTTRRRRSPGGGPPQANFALESAVDMLAEKLGIDALEFRKMNSLKPGQTKSTGMVVQQWPFPELCDLIKPYYDKAKKAAADFNKSEKGPVRQGVGIGAHSFGIGASGDLAQMFVEVNSDDTVTIYGSVADPGEGNDSMLTQLAAQILEMPMDRIRLYTRDTDKAPNAGIAASSRMTYVAGGALVNALQPLRLAMDEAGSKTYTGLKKAGKATHYDGYRNTGGSPRNDPKTGQGDSFITDVQNIQMAEVEVNTETGETKVIKMTTVVDAGPIINPQSLEGQLEGGMDQGVGWALREEYVAGKTKDWVTFKFPTINNTYEVEIHARENAPRRRASGCDRHRRDDHGVHRPGSNQRDQECLRGEDLQSAGDAGQSEGSAGRQGQNAQPHFVQLATGSSPRGSRRNVSRRGPEVAAGTRNKTSVEC